MISIIIPKKSTGSLIGIFNSGACAEEIGRMSVLFSVANYAVCIKVYL